jgi:hypothetical protein
MGDPVNSIIATENVMYAIMVGMCGSAFIWRVRGRFFRWPLPIFAALGMGLIAMFVTLMHNAAIRSFGLGNDAGFFGGYGALVHILRLVGVVIWSYVFVRIFSGDPLSPEDKRDLEAILRGREGN